MIRGLYVFDLLLVNQYQESVRQRDLGSRHRQPGPCRARRGCASRGAVASLLAVPQHIVLTSTSQRVAGGSHLSQQPHGAPQSLPHTMSQCVAALPFSGPAAASKQQAGRRQPRAVVLAAAGSSGPALRTLEPSRASSTSSSSNGAPPVQQQSAASTSGSGAAAPAAEAAVKSYRVSPWQAMKWGGPVPERVNMRLAMLAFPYIVQQEMQTGQTGEGGCGC